jgi:ribonuclease HI
MAINEHPIKSKLEDPTTNDLFANRMRITKPFHIQTMDAAAALYIDYQRIRQYYTSFHLPWMMN